MTPVGRWQTALKVAQSGAECPSARHSRRPRPSRLEETQQDAQECLAGAGFTDDRQRLAFIDIEIDRVDRAPALAAPPNQLRRPKLLMMELRGKGALWQGPPSPAMPRAFVDAASRAKAGVAFAARRTA
jgi:hypothetical protein